MGYNTNKTRRKMNNISILVIRKSKHGIKNSRPCIDCIKTMRVYNIKRVYYSNDDSEIVCENIKDMLSGHTCKLMKSIQRIDNLSLPCSSTV